METPPLFLFHALLRFGVFKRIFHAFVCLSLDVEIELEWLDEAWAGKQLVSCDQVEESCVACMYQLYSSTRYQRSTQQATQITG